MGFVKRRGRAVSVGLCRAAGRGAWRTGRADLAAATEAGLDLKPAATGGHGFDPLVTADCFLVSAVKLADDRSGDL